MAYEARRDDDLERARNDQNNTNNIRNAADVAIASKNPYGVAAGGAVKAADAVTGGKASESLGKALTRANETVPGGRNAQEALNRMSESGMSSAAGRAARVYNGKAGEGGTTPNQVAHNGDSGGEQGGSLPSSSDKQTPTPSVVAGGGEAPKTEEKVETPKGGGDANESPKDDEEKKEGKGIFQGVGSTVAKIAIASFIPVFVIFCAIIVVLFAVSNFFEGFSDAFGASDLSGEEYGELEFEPESQEQKDFLDRVNTIKLQYQSQGKVVDSVKIVGVFYVLNSNGANLDYEKVSDSEIKYVIDQMLSDGYYDETTFKTNLVNSIIPKYLPKTNHDEREIIADEVIQYIADYYDFIGRPQNDSSSGGVCSTESGECSYEIKGYSISGKGNVSENIKVSNLYVRLMQCGSTKERNYGGTFGQDLEGESLVPFEKYVLGVSYASMGADAPAEAFKAQTVVARSYSLARHAELGGWRTLKEENGKWILQAASCAQDQIYCDPDKGCSSDSGGQIYSGSGHNGSFSMPALSDTSPLRSYAAATEGEVLTNSEGYIIETGYSVSEKEQFTSLANSGTGYKQILLQVYNQGSRKYNASNVSKNTCSGNGISHCISSGEYSKWKQYDAKWANVPMGNSGKNIRQIGCLATSVSILIAKSGVPTNVANFNPGTFVQFLNSNGGFAGGGNFVWASAAKAAPSFQYQGKIYVAGMTQSQKLSKIQELVNTPGVYVVAEVKGNTGQHWVAIDSVNGSVVNMMDPGSNATNLWSQYNWGNTSVLAYFKVQ